MRFLCGTRAACALLALCCASAYGQEQPLLSVDNRTSVAVPQAVPLAAVDDPTVIRQRPAAIQVGRLSELHSELQSRQGVAAVSRGIAGTTDTLTLNLFDDMVVTGLVDRTESTIADGFVVSGGIADDPRGDFVLAVVGNSVAGMVHTGGSHYEIVSAGDGLITVVETDPSQFECGVDRVAPPVDDEGDQEDDLDPARDGVERSGQEAAGQATAAPALRASVQVLADERAVLEELYESAGGSGWQRKDKWLSNAPLGDWQGVDTAGDGRVRGIRLRNNRLVGTLPRTLSNLAGLKQLDVPRNPGLNGILPASITALPLSELVYYGTDLCLPDTSENERWSWKRGRFDGHFCPSTHATEIEIAVPFTTKAMDQYGGIDGARAHAAALVVATNRALSQSGVLVQMNLAAAEETPYEEKGGYTMGVLFAALRHVTDPGDGEMDDVHVLRDGVAADVVLLLTSVSGGGIAYVFPPQSTKGHERLAFGVSAARATLTFMHELGHILGLRHDRHVSNCGGACVAGAGTTYGFGYTNRDGLDGTSSPWRTIMAYGSLCQEHGSSCARLARFSNPANEWGTPPRPMGVDGAYYTDDLWGPANSVRTLNWTRRTIARYRHTRVLTVSFGSTSATATEGGNAAFVTLRLSETPGSSKQISLSVAQHGGASPDDYVVPTTVVFPRGVAERTIVVRATDDAHDDDGESVVLQIAGDLPYGVTVGDPDSVTIDFEDNDGADGVPPFRLRDASVFESDGPARFSVEMRKALSSDLVVTYSTADDSALAGADYTSSSGHLTIAAGDTEGEIAVPILTDDLAESTEEFSVTVSATVDMLEARATATGVILDTAGIPLGPAGVSGVPAGWPLTPAGETAAGNGFRLLFVTSTARDATATDIDTYNWFVRDRVAAGHAALHPYAAGFRVLGRTADVDAAANTGLPASASDDPVPVYWLNGGRIVSDSAALLEGTWENLAPTDENGTARTGTCPLGGTAPCVFTGQDANALDGWVLGGGVNPLGVTGEWVTVGRPRDIGKAVDAEQEARPTASLPLYGLSPVLRVQSGFVLPTASVAGGRWEESAGTADFTVSLGRPAEFEASLAYATVDATAEAGLDYTAVRGRLSFAVGEQTKTVSVPLTDDARREPDETFVLVLGAPRNATLSEDGAAATGVIVGTPEVAELSLRGPPRAVLESSGAAVFTVFLARPSTREVTATYQTVEISGGGSDFIAATGTFTIAAGETHANAAVPILDDADFEPEESFARGAARRHRRVGRRRCAGTRDRGGRRHARRRDRADRATRTVGLGARSVGAFGCGQ